MKYNITVLYPCEYSFDFHWTLCRDLKSFKSKYMLNTYFRYNEVTIKPQTHRKWEFKAAAMEYL